MGGTLCRFMTHVERNQYAFFFLPSFVPQDVGGAAQREQQHRRYSSLHGAEGC